jgi:asparagine synthase (glutamine-hydrolysing)
MCGIAGIVRFDEPGINASMLSQLSIQLRHRGPDDHGFVGWSPCEGARVSKDASVADHRLLGLATRRLSILDLSDTGAQPMQSDDGRYWIAYNGEVYNYVELRSELEKAGCRFRSTSDTEVVLHALKRWGRPALQRLTGMFALAFFDAARGELLLARDQFGMKPLFLVRVSSGLVFSSEINPLLSAVPNLRTLNPLPALQYLRFGRSDETSETMIEGVESLQPGHTVSVRIHTKEVGAQLPYWQLNTEQRHDVSFAEAAAITREKFLRNVDTHLRSDVPVGACLSGGLDSSACVSAMRYLKGSALDIHTFTYSAGQTGIDETKWASAVSSAAHSHAHVAKGSAGDLASEVDTLIRLQGAPFATTSIYAQHVVFKLIAANGIKVVLDGQGADEMFGGYAVFLAARIASSLKTGRLLEGLGLARAARNKGGFAHAPLVAAQYLFPERIQRRLRRVIGRDIAPRWISQNWSNALVGQPKSIAHAEDLLRTELRSSLVGSLRALLRYEDRNSMAVSVESRLPFLTVDLVEFMLALPGEYLIASDGTTKAVFREAMKGIVPEAVLKRTDKISFQTPEFEWLRELSPWANRVLTSELARTCPLINFEHAERAWAESMHSSRNYRPWVWRVLNLVRWAELNSITWPTASQAAA